MTLYLNIGCHGKLSQVHVIFFAREINFIRSIPQGAEVKQANLYLWN